MQETGTIYSGTPLISMQETGMIYSGTPLISMQQIGMFSGTTSVQIARRDWGY